MMEFTKEILAEEPTVNFVSNDDFGILPIYFIATIDRSEIIYFRLMDDK